MRVMDRRRRLRPSHCPQPSALSPVETLKYLKQHYSFEVLIMSKKIPTKQASRAAASVKKKAAASRVVTVAAGQFARTGPRRVILDSPLQPKRLSEAELTKMLAKVLP